MHLPFNSSLGIHTGEMTADEVIQVGEFFRDAIGKLCKSSLVQCHLQLQLSKQP
jgi:hypothetical protein